MTFLSGKSIQVADPPIIKGGDDNQYRDVSYDVTVGKIFVPDGYDDGPYDQGLTDFKLPPGGVVEVVTKEIICVPNDIFGLAIVKTGLSKEGILALNIGIIDPGWEGPISTTLVNFGKSDYFLTKGTTILRLIFQQFDKPVSSKPKIMDAEEYEKEIMKISKEKLSNSFLDIESVSNKAAEKAFSQYKTLAGIYIPLLLTGIAVLISGVMLLQDHWSYTNQLNLLGKYWETAPPSVSLGVPKEVFDNQIAITRALKEAYDRQIAENRELSANYQKQMEETLKKIEAVSRPSIQDRKTDSATPLRNKPVK